jgi:hypothetical protein
MDLMPSFIVSTSYEQYVARVMQRVGIQLQNVACTRFPIEHYRSLASEEDVFFSMRFLLQRPLLKAILSDQPTVLLIDEIDRSDAEFEAFLLEVLSDFQIICITTKLCWKNENITMKTSQMPCFMYLKYYRYLEHVASTRTLTPATAHGLSSRNGTSATR